MQENKLKSTIDSLHSLGQISSIEKLAEDIKEAYDYAISILKEYDSTIGKPKQATPIINSVSGDLKDKALSEKYKEYDSDWKLAFKYLYILKTENRFLHMREAARVMINLEGLEKSYENEKEVARTLGNSIRNFKKDGTIIKKYHKGNHKNCFWGSSKWVDENNNILPEYKYSTDILNLKIGRKKQSNLFEL